MLKSIGITGDWRCCRYSPRMPAISARAHPRAHALPGERPAGRPRRRAARAGNWPPNTSPRNWRWPAPSRPARTAPISRRSRWWGSRRSRAPHCRGAAGARAWISSGATISWASAGRSSPDTRFEGDAVFVGHGITAPEFKWDDFKGVDVTGKILVLFTNEPPSTDPKFFDGRALTYYGRWTYKYEEALRARRQGLHHHPHHADGQLRLGRGAQLLGPGSAVREAGAGRQGAAVAGLGHARGGREAAGAGRARTVDELLKASDRRDFQPVRARHSDARAHAVEDPRAGDAQRGGDDSRAAIRS